MSIQETSFIPEAIGVPVNFNPTITASDLAQMVADQGGEVSSVLKWDSGYEAWIADFPTQKDFPIEPGRGYFVRIARPPTDGHLVLEGVPFTSSVTINLVTGFNLIGAPFATLAAACNSKILAEAMDSGGAVSSILKWEAGYKAWLSDFPGEKIFAIDSLSGYFVRMIRAATWSTP